MFCLHILLKNQLLEIILISGSGRTHASGFQKRRADEKSSMNRVVGKKRKKRRN
jgi:hypothetical protein